jgi:hypothetical protein
MVLMAFSLTEGEVNGEDGSVILLPRKPNGFLHFDK